MPSMENEALRLVALAYEAVADQSQWPNLLKALAEAFKAHGALLRQVDYQTDQVGFSETLGYEECYVRAYREHYVHLDHYREILMRQPVGAVLTSERVMRPDVRRRSVYFNEYERPQDRIHVLGSVLARQDASVLYLGLHRGQGGREFSDRELEFIRLLLPHLTQAVRLHGLLSQFRQRQSLSETVLDHLRMGVFLTDVAGRPFLVNRAAERLLSRSHALSLGPDGLMAARPRDTARLRQLIASAAAVSAGQATSGGGDLGISGPDGLTSVQVWVAPLSRKQLDIAAPAPSACAALFVSRPDERGLPWRRIAAHHGLTPAEARLAAALCEGLSLEEAAERLGIKLTTVRTHLKSSFAKTGARRQAELMGKLMGGVLAQCRMEPEEP